MSLQLNALQDLYHFMCNIMCVLCVGVQCAHHEFDLIGYQLDNLYISSNHLICVKLFLNYVVCQVDENINLLTELGIMNILALYKHSIVI